MSRKIKYNSISPFHDRLYVLLGDNVDAWADKIGVSAALIRDKWFKGSFPGADKIVKISEVTGKSTDWILTGKEAGESAKNNETGSEGNEVKDDGWELKMLIESMSKRMDDQAAHIESLVKGITRYKDDINTLQQANVQFNAAINEINARLGRYADSGDITSLKKAVGE